VRRFSIFACLICGFGSIGAFASAAEADSVGPITFESADGYVVGNIDGQNGWMKTGGYDAAVASVASFPSAPPYPSFGGQSLQISDAVTSGSFGDQTFSPALSQPAGESGMSHFAMSFQIGTAVAANEAGLHMTVSPDDGFGSRMSFLRFDDEPDGVHVTFVDVTDPGPPGTVAAFNAHDIATLPYGSSAHTIGMGITFQPGPANDIVNVSVDGVLKFTGTTWEDYYRYDPEQAGNGNVVPSVSKLLFRESGDANPADMGNGFLVDNIVMSSSATAACVQTGFMRDGINLTAAQIGGSVTGTLDANGCNIGAYNPTSVNGADISGANYFGVVANHKSVNLIDSSIHDIGEVPPNGAQHGNAVLYINGATGTISGNLVSRYQKNGITVSGKDAAGDGPSAFATSATVKNNVVSGRGAVDYIAQNGIQMSFGAKGSVVGNTVTENAYSGPGGASSGGILVVGGPCFGPGIAYTKNLTIRNNTLIRNDVGVFLFNATATDCVAPSIKTDNSVKLNTISNGAVTNTTGDTVSPACGYQAGVSDVGHRDAIVNNSISGFGYTPTASGDCTGPHPAFLRFIDTDSSARALPSNK
jgi:hypothetical protein